MKSQIEIQEWINTNLAEMQELEKDGEDRDWGAYEDLKLEKETLEAVLNG